MTTRVLGIVPARGGSKGIPRKNLASLRGRPLIAYTAAAVHAAQRLTRSIVSTEDEEIAEVCAGLGLEVPFRRPPELARDETPSLPVVRHALDHMESTEQAQYDIVVLLQPTCPLRTGEDIDKGVDLLVRSQANSVVSVASVGAHHPYRMKTITSEGRLANLIEQGFEDMRPRQQLPEVYIRNGAVYATRRAVIIEQERLVGDDCLALVMPVERSVNVDSDADLILAEHYLRRAAETESR